MLHFLGMQINTTNKEKCIKVLTFFFKRLARRTIYNNIKAAVDDIRQWVYRKIFILENVE